MSLVGVAVLLVEDDPDSREMTRLMLEALGARVVTAEHGQAGLDALRIHAPDVALVDLMMPVMDGFVFAERVRHDPNYRSVRLVALTALTDEASFGQTRRIGFDGHLVKPITSSALDSLLQFYVAAKPDQIVRRSPSAHE
jgi:CheY-like chemotaxis protein